MNKSKYDSVDILDSCQVSPTLIDNMHVLPDHSCNCASYREISSARNVHHYTTIRTTKVISYLQNRVRFLKMKCLTLQAENQFLRRELKRLSSKYK